MSDDGPFFPDSEYASRWSAVRDVMAQRDIDALLITSPENIYYLLGLSHQGYFTFTLLILPREGEALIVARGAEAATISDQVKNARHIGYAEGDDPAETVTAGLRGAGLASARLGLEQGGYFLPPLVAERVQATLPSAEFVDASGYVDGLRSVQSSLELSYTRQAAEIADKTMSAAIETASVGTNERDVAARSYEVMISAGGEYPGFAPLIKSNEAIQRMHTTWRNRNLLSGDVLFIELAACVRRYHASLLRQIYVGRAPAGIGRVQSVAVDAHQATVEALKPGATTGEVYRAWHEVVNAAFGQVSSYNPHCGYLVGIGFPPAWVSGPDWVRGSGANGIHADGEITVLEGMVFHIMSWVKGPDGSGHAVSDTAEVTASGGELLTSVTRELTVR